MIEIIKNLFRKKEKEYVPDPPGRTFKRIETGRYFSCEDLNADTSHIAKAKQKKIDQIAELGLLPMFIRYTYKHTNEVQRGEDRPDTEVSSVHVVFQKEVSAKKWNMTHVTEISFIVNRCDFDEFEKMSGIRLEKDFRDLTTNKDHTPYRGKERRREER